MHRKALLTLGIVVALGMAGGFIYAASNSVKEKGNFKINFEKVDKDFFYMTAGLNQPYSSNKDAAWIGSTFSATIAGVEFTGLVDAKGKVTTEHLTAKLVANGRGLQFKIKKANLADAFVAAGAPEQTERQGSALVLVGRIATTKDGSTTVLGEGPLTFRYKANGKKGSGKLEDNLD